MNINCLIVILLVFASVDATQVIHRNKLEAGLLKIIEKCKKGDLASLPIPLRSLKALKIPQFEAHVDEYSIQMSGMEVQGLEDLSMVSLTASESHLSTMIELHVPKIAITADEYTLIKYVVFHSFPVKFFGKHLTANIENLSAKADMRFTRKGKDTEISNLNLSYLVEHAQVRLPDSPSLVNNKANHILTDLINEDFKNLVHEKIIHIANNLLKGHTPEELINIISKF